ncbi:PQQ-dependent sugar dehydrogenase [Sinomicrobium sp. M5D2P9]
MKTPIVSISLLLIFFVFGSCKNDKKPSREERKEIARTNDSVTVTTAVGDIVLPPPYATKSVTKESKLVEWEENQTPKAPEGFTVSRFADELDSPRWTYIAPNGDYFVAESNTKNSADRITLLRDTNGDGDPDLREVFLENLHQPLGMLVLNNYFYVANTDGLYRYPYTEGVTKLETEGEKIVELSASGYNNHWTRNIISNPEGSKIYISVGSASNAGEQGMEKEQGRALIFEVNPDGSEKRVYASGLRNPVGMDWNPVTGDLWTAVNERDELGDDLVPDYATSVQEESWYGWPYSYFGQIRDPRWKDDPHPELVKKAIVPDVPLGNHTASLGFTFYDAKTFPVKYRNGAFVGQHGSWNRSVLSGYKVVFIPFKGGNPQPPEDFLTGFIANKSKNEVYGRPVGVAVTPLGDLLVNDDEAGIIWRVSADK